MRVPIGRTSNIESIDWQLADIHNILIVCLSSKILLLKEESYVTKPI